MIKNLVYLDGDSGLVVRVGGKGLGLFSGDGGVPLDQGGHNTTCGLDTHRQWGNIEQQKVGDRFVLFT